MFGGIDIHVVEPGTEIEHGDEKLTVTETEAVRRGHRIYMTQAHYDALRSHPGVRVERTGDER